MNSGTAPKQGLTLAALSGMPAKLVTTQTLTTIPDGSTMGPSCCQRLKYGADPLHGRDF